MSEHKLCDSATIFGITSKGWPASFTVYFEEGVNMAQRLAELTGDLEKLKVVPGVILRNPVGSTTPTTPTTETTPEPQKAPADRPATSQDHGEFDATEIIYTNSAGKEGYKIKGGIFSKFGISAYPEMLEGKGVNLEELKKKGSMPFNAKVEWYTHESANGLYKRIKNIIVVEDSIPW